MDEEKYYSPSIELSSDEEYKENFWKINLKFFTDNVIKS
jgi:hypothetical protein